MSPNLSDLVLIVISVVVSALCSGLEVAFLSSNKLYIELERKRGAIWARLISPLLKRPERVIGALLVGLVILYGAGLIPVLGAAMWMAVTFVGMGALLLGLFRRTESIPMPPPVPE